jgi:hypothetical protein
MNAARQSRPANRSGGVQPRGARPLCAIGRMGFLVANGYQLAEVERVIVGERNSEGVYSEYCS